MITSFRIPGAIHQPALAKPSAQRRQALTSSCSDEPKDTYTVRFTGGGKDQVPAERVDNTEAHQKELDELIRRAEEQVAILSGIRQKEKDGSRQATVSDQFIEHGQTLIAKMRSWGEEYIAKKD